MNHIKIVFLKFVTNEYLSKYIFVTVKVLKEILGSLIITYIDELRKYVYNVTINDYVLYFYR